MSAPAQERKTSVGGVKRDNTHLYHERMSSDDSLLLNEIDVKQLKYKDFSSNGGGDIAFVSYNNTRVFTEMECVLGYKLSKFAMTADSSKSNQSKKAFNEYSVTLFMEDNPDVHKFHDDLDNHNIDTIVEKSENPKWFGDKRDRKDVERSCYVKSVVTNNKKTGKVTPRVKYKVCTDQLNGLPIVEIYDCRDDLLYKHTGNPEIDAADIAERKAKGLPEWADPDTLTSAKERVILKTQYTGLFRTGTIGTTQKVLLIKKCDDARKVTHAFRLRRSKTDLDAEKEEEKLENAAEAMVTSTDVVLAPSVSVTEDIESATVE